MPFSTLSLLTIIPLLVPRVLSSYDFSKAHPMLVKIEMIAEKVDQVAEAAADDIKNQYALKGLYDHSASDTDSDSSSLMSDGNFEDIVEDLKVYNEGLIDLTPSLETPANDSVVIEDINLTLMDDLSSISEPARPYVLLIKDRFPSTPANLVKRLGEANWQRRERLREKKASAPAMGPDSSNEDETSSMSETVTDNVQHRISIRRSPRTSIIDSSVSFASIYQSNTTVSDFSNPSIFDHDAVQLPVIQKARIVAESVTSFATSMADGGQRRVPNLPYEHDFESPFQCTICGDVLRDIRSRADWK
jgi:hypothetical protein